MKFPELKIGSLKPKYPIIQGGMAIKISMAKLASAVASEGGIGVIAGSALSVKELKDEIKKARQMTDGILGVNIMYAVTDFMKLLKASVSAGIDVIISGAGFSRDMFGVGKEAGIPVVPIVSSLRLARISEKLGASAVVVEGGDAGGHLGTDQGCRNIISKIKEKINIPVIAAGDIITPREVSEMFSRGMDGVQMGTRFLASRESAVADYFKELCVKTKKEDVLTIMSSAGLPANAIRTRFSELIKAGQTTEPETCDNCLKHCTRTFCVKDALIRGKEGDKDKGLFFAGKGIGKINEILSVKQIFRELIEY